MNKKTKVVIKIGTTVSVGCVINGLQNLSVWILHSENCTLEKINNTYTYAWGVSSAYLYNSEANKPGKVRIIVSENTEHTINPNHSNCYTLVNGCAGSPSQVVCSTGNYTADFKFWGSAAEDTSVKRDVITVNGKTRYLSDPDFGLGDYLYEYDPATGKVMLVASLLDEVHDTYNVPGTVSYKGEAYNFPGERAFYSCKGLIDLVLDGTEKIGNSTFENCLALQKVESQNIKTLGGRTFYGCSSLVYANFPKLQISSGENFRSCSNLRVLETNVYSYRGTNRNVAGCKELLVWILHTENGEVTTIEGDTFRYGDLHQYYLFDVAEEKPEKLRLIVSENITNQKYNSNPQNYYTKITNATSIKVSTGQFTADKMFWVSAPENDPGRVKITIGDQTSYLSDYGLGDYLYEYDSNGNAILAMSLMDELSGHYEIAGKITDSKTNNVYNVVEVGHRTFKWTKFNSGSEISLADGIQTVGAEAFATGWCAKQYKQVSLPSTIAKLGKHCFYQAPSLVAIFISNEDSPVEANEDIYGSTSYPAGFKVRVSKKAYDNIYCSAENVSKDWGGIAKSYFDYYEALYQPVAGGPKFYLMAYLDGFEVSFIENVPADALELEIPNSYYIGEVEQGDLIRIKAETFAPLENHSTLKTITLPKNLLEIDTNGLVLPKNLQAFKIDENAPYFETAGGVLYSKGKATLYVYPAAKTETTFAMPIAVYAIAPEAFRGAKNLTTVTGTAEGTFAGYLFVAEKAFENCIGLESVEFGRSVMLSRNAFDGCTALTEVKFLGEKATEYLGADPLANTSVTRRSKTGNGRFGEVSLTP